MRYVGRVIRLAFLAPDIVEAIVEGRQQPISLTAETVTRNTEAMVAGAVDDATNAELARHFDAEACVELAMTASYYCMVPRILSAIAVTPAGEPGA